MAGHHLPGADRSPGSRILHATILPQVVTSSFLVCVCVCIHSVSALLGLLTVAPESTGNSHLVVNRICLENIIPPEFKQQIWLRGT